MKSKIFMKAIIGLILCVFSISSIKAQDVPFTPRINDGGNTYFNIKGDYTFLSNSVMNVVDSATGSTNIPYNDGDSNNSLHIEYIDIDNDSSTFSSSSSTLTLPDCSQIHWAGLYWAGNYDRERRNQHGTYNNNYPTDNNHYDATNVKLKLPGSTTYIDLQADNNADLAGEEDDVIIDGYGNTSNNPYVCFKNVTNQLQSLTNPAGEYTVANVRGTKGTTNHGVAGWTLVIIYENPTLPGRYISVFDGYEGVTTQSGNSTADITVSGFNTIPAGPVNARLGVSALEGESSLSGDTFGIVSNSNSTFTDIANTVNPNNNFFNSTISEDGANVLSRNINSTNSLGYDSDVFDLNNPSNSIIDNGDTSATLRLGTNGDWFAAFLVAFAVEIIEPNIVVEKKVEDIGGNDITGLGVNLGQELDYVLSFQNTGNDDATNYTLRDVLPINVSFIPTDLVLPTDVTYTYDAISHTISFSIPDNLVEEGDPVSQIRLRVQVAENCFDFVNACTDLIQNLAYSTYEGVINDNQITDDPSVSDFDDCGFTTPGATNFLLDDLEDCDFSRTLLLCGDEALLDAGDNFDDYIWYKDENGDGLIDAGDTVITDGNPDNDLSTLEVDEVGVYIVDKIVADPCKGFQEIITVTLFGATQTNPITSLINDTSNTVEGQILVCANDGEELPEVFLCGLNDTELIQVNIPDADSIEWQQLDENSCSAAVSGCANKNGSCTWNNIETGSDFTATDAGEYRLIINYLDGCSSRFYFNVYKNPLDPQYNKTDIICTTPGNITVTNMPADYEYQLLDATDSSVEVPYSANNGPSFNITSNGAYTVEMRQLGVVDGCIFRLDNIGVLLRNYQVDIDTKDTDCNGLGEIEISALNVNAQYYYEISQGGTSLDTFGPTNDNNYTFLNLNDGIYDVLVTTDDGCTYTEQVTIFDVTDLDVDATLTKSIDCTDGIITVTGSGGVPNPDYAYAIWSYNGVDLYPTVDDIPGGAYQIINDFNFDNTEAGDYEFIVVDSNNCSDISNIITISVSSAVVYTTSTNDELCYGAADGSYSVNVTNSNGYTLSYELLNPDTSTTTNASGTFTGLEQGNYTLTITQSQGSISCDFIETFTVGGPINNITGIAVLTQDYTCLQNGTIEAQNISGGTAPYEYSRDGVTFSSIVGAETFSGLTNGTYSIFIRDANNCIFETNSVTIDPLNEPTDLTFVATQAICPALTSDVTVSVVNGNSPFVFEIIAPSAIAANTTTGNSASFNGLAPNTYTFRVTDNKGCSYDESFTIVNVTPIGVVGQLISNVSCFTATDGEALFTVSGFNTSYDYTITGPATFSGTTESNTTIPLTSLDDGTYTITVTDNDTNCTNTTAVIIAAPAAALTLTATETSPTCLADGSVILTATGGWGSNSFTLINPDTSIFGTNTTGLFSGLTDTSGAYTATVTDANNCIVTTTFTITAAIAPSLSIVPNNDCYDSGAGLTLTANITAGGDGNYEYSLNGGVYDANNIFAGLSPGTHTITVRDSNDCTDTQNITINPELTIIATADNIFACASTTDVTITAAGGDNNYVYAAVANGVAPTPGNFGTANVISIPGAGDYDIYVRDNNGGLNFCEVNYDLNITQDATVGVAVASTPILCSGDASSIITLTASGGQGPYTYSINNGSTYQTVNTFVNQSAGGYTVRIRDANGCEASETHTISEPFTLSASAAVADLAECNPTLGAEVRITNAQGGTTPYEYSFDGGVNYSTNPIGNLLPGSHTLFLRDANNCTFPMNVTIDPQPTAPNVAAAISYECDGEGTAVLTPDNPAYDYTYDIDGTPNTPNSSNTFNNIPVGPHTVTINYVNSTPPVPSILLTEDFGTGANTAISGLDPVYCYESQDTSTETCTDSNNRINDLEYSVTQSIVQPFSSWLSPNDPSLTPNGRFLVINVGAPGYNTIIYEKRDIEIIPNRDIEVSIAVFNLLRQGTSGLDPDILIELVDATNTVIASASTGSIPKNTGANDWHNITIPALNPGANTSIDIVIRTIGNVTSGNDVVIDDIIAQQIPEVCPQSVNIPIIIEDGRAFAANTTSISNVVCNGESNGSITFEVENFDAINGFEYRVNGGAFSAPQTTSPITISSLSAGALSIEIRDVLDNTCAITLTETITEPAPVVTAANITSVLTCTDGGTITASATGGTPNYEYQLEDTLGNPIGLLNFANNGNNNIFTGLIAGNYIVRARDLNNCMDATGAPITIAGPQSIVFTTTPTACYTGNSDGTILINVTAGNGGYQFSLDGGPWMTPTPSTATTYTFSNLVANSYTIDVRDDFGCPVLPITQTVPLNDQLLLSANLTQDVTCLVDATITLNASGGSGTYTYEWSNASTGPWNTSGITANVHTTNTDGTYFYRITDTTTPISCSVVSNSIEVTPADTPVVTSITPTNLICNGDDSGALDIIINTSVGLAPYTLEIINTTTTTNYGTQAHGLAAGNYTVTLTDAKGCDVTLPATIAQPDVITYTASHIPITCDVAGTTTNPGSISITGISGGTAEYTYYLTANNGITPQTHITTTGTRDHTFSILTFGIYQIDVVDANGCSAFTTEIIASPPNDLDIDVSTATASCAVGGTAIVTVGAAVGSGNYEFAILDDFNSPYSSSYVAPDVLNGSTATFTGLTPGVTYTFVVHDLTTLCYYFETAASPILTPSNMTATLDTVANVSCTGSADGNLSFTFNNYDVGATAVNYEIFNSQSNITTTQSGTTTVSGPVTAQTISNFATLPPGEYYLLLSEVGGAFAGCSVFGGEFTIRESVNMLQVTAASPTNDTYCTANAGVITATAQFGTAPYEFQYLLTTDSAPTAMSAGWTTNTTTNAAAGYYRVYVKDAYGCIQFDDVTVIEDPRPLIIQSTVDECAGEGNFQMTVTLTQIGMPPYQLSVNGSSYQNITFDINNEYVVSGLNSGSLQDIEIRDVNGCGDHDNFSILPVLQATAAVTKLLDCTASPEAEITIEATTGSGNYSYAITNTAGAPTVGTTTFPSNPFVYQAPVGGGDYTITITDNTTNCTQNFVINVANVVLPSFIESHIDVTCNSGSDGSITLSQIDNGISPLSYSISPVAGTFNATTNTFEGLPAGTYDITATSTINGCSSTTTGIIVSQPDAITNINTSIVEFGCTAGNNPNNASITIVNGIIGGSGNYTRFEFINTTTGNTQIGTNRTYIETNPLGGSFTINVYDDNNCVGTIYEAIAPYDELLTASAAITGVISCNPIPDGEITITATSTSNNTALFEYSTDGINYQTSNIFSLLDVGTHNFYVRHTVTGCIRTTSETILEPNTFTIDVVKLQDVVCEGTETGEITLQLIDATYIGSMAWVIYDSNGTVDTADDILYKNEPFSTTGPTAPITLIAGDYIVEVIQNGLPSCSNIEAFTIAGPTAPLDGNENRTPITCNGNDGVIEIIDAIGGWGNYEYYVGTTPPAGIGSYVTTPRFDNLGVATYQAWIRDSSGCEYLINNNINLSAPNLIIGSLQINQENCTNLEGEIEVINVVGGQGSNYTYQLIKDAVPFGATQTTRVFSGLGAGSYEVLITDQWDCSFTTPAELLYEEINLTTTVNKSIDCSVTPGGTITVNVLGGSSSLEYIVTYPDLTTITNNTGVFPGLTQAGVYSFVVNDLNTTNPVCSKNITEELDAPTPVTFNTPTRTHVSCNGGSDGEVTINLTPTALGINDNPVYSYTLYESDGTTVYTATQNNPTFIGLVDGFYEVEVISSRGCSNRQPFEITEPIALTATATATAFACNINNTATTATITAIANDGTAPYLYSIDGTNFQTSNTFEVIDNGLAQNITVTVVDANNCSTNAVVATIQALNVFTATVSQNVAISCVNPEEVLITVSDNGDITNSYTYELLPLGNPSGGLTATPTNITATFDITSVGSYTFRITDNSTGCYVDTISYDIAPYDLIDVISTPTAAVTCFNGTAGAAEINITGYTGGYTYEVFNSNTGISTGNTGSGNTSTNPNQITGLTGGSYFIRVTETATPECIQDSNSFTIISPDLPLVATSNPLAPPTCTDDQGEISVLPSGGYFPYDIVLTNTTTTQSYTVNDVNSHIFTGLAAGSYTIAVTDNGGCIYNDTEILTAAIPITADILASTALLVCYGDTDATISAINVIGGESVYQYQLNHYDTTGTTITFTTGAQTNPIFNNLGAGIYSITITDGWSCSQGPTTTLEIQEPIEVFSSLLQNSSMTCLNDAEIILTAGGGTAPYEYSIDDITYLPMASGNTHTFTVTDGVYQYYVRDSFGCEAMQSNQISVEAVPTLTIAIDDSAAQINCSGEATATIIATASGGLGNYVYELYGDAALTDFRATNTTGVFSNLAADDYYVHVTSGDCERTTLVITITEPVPLQIDTQNFTDITCNNANDGTISVAVSGGTGDILYAITPNLNQFDTENTFTELEPGDYVVIAQDESGCFIVFDFTIIQPEPLTATFAELAEVCAGNEDGSVSLTIEGGTAPYRTAFNSNADADFVQDQFLFTDLAAGTYAIFIRDAQNCEINVIVEIDGGVDLSGTVTPIYSCSGDVPTAEIDIVFNDPTIVSDVLYALDSTNPADLQLNYDFGDITPGLHTLIISHSNGCINSIDFEIETFEPLFLTLEQNNINEITAIATGGREDYTYTFDGVNNGDDNTYYISRTDTFTVTVTDANGCESSAEIFVEFIDVELPNFFTPNNDGDNDYWKPKNIEQFPKILTLVFDRYGREVYRMGLNDQGWDGFYNNTTMPTGDYWYVIKLKGETDNREFVGHFTLYR